MINFTGKYISTSTVYKQANSGKYKNSRAAVVEVFPKSKKDMKFLEQTADLWRAEFGFEVIANKIHQNATHILQSEADASVKDNYQSKFYAITTQRGHFDKLKPEKALALAELSLITDDLLELDLCQVEPSCEHKQENRKYKRIGTALINFIKKEFKEHTIILTSLDGVKGFYKALGFESISSDNTRWMFKRK